MLIFETVDPPWTTAGEAARRAEVTPARGAPGALDRPVAVTLFPNAFAREKHEAAWTPRRLAREIAEATAGWKGDLPWLKLARFGDTRSEKDSLRHDANVLAVSGVEADYDGERLSVDHACGLLEKRGVAAVVYASPSHTEDKPRWRVLCPLSAEMPPERRAHMLGRLNGLFRGVFAGESFTLSQAYYFGRVGGSPSHRVELVDGAPIDEHDDLDEVWTGRPGGGCGGFAGDSRWNAAGGGATGAGADPVANGEARGDAELVRRVLTGEGYHGELCALAARYVGRGMGAETAVGALQGLMLARPDEGRDARWRERFGDIERLVAGAVKKYAGEREARKALARLARRMIDGRRPSAEIRETIRAEAEARRIDPSKALEIAAWVARQELLRREAGHA